MLKIIKHEFIKTRASLLALLITAAALYALSLLGGALHREWMKYVSLALLMLYAGAAYVYTLARGISAYSAELKNRTGYLLMLTPRSTYTILFGKLIFSLLLAALMLAASYFAITGVLAEIFGSRLALRGYYNILRALAEQAGVNPEQVTALMLTALISTLVNILMLVSLGYFATTISATLFRGGKGHGFITFLFFIALFIALMAAEYYLLPALLRDGNYDALASGAEVFRQVLPVIAFNIAAMCGLTCASAALLKKRVCL